MSILFISNNWYKISLIKELARSLNLKIEIINEKIDIKDSENLKNNIIINLQDLFSKYKKPLFIAKSGLYLEAHPDFPGTQTSFVSSTIGMHGIFKLIKSESNNASVKTLVGYTDGKEVILEEYNLEGSLVKTHDCDGWFFDPYFFPKKNNFSLSLMSETEKKSYWIIPFQRLLKKLSCQKIKANTMND